MRFLYRNRSPFHVEGGSLRPDAYENSDLTYHAWVEIDPDTEAPDGIDIGNANPKVYDSGAGTIRNATQLEIDEIPVAEAIDKNLQERASAKALLTNSNAKLWRALLELILSEINILRAEHSLAPRTKAQLITALENEIDSGNSD